MIAAVDRAAQLLLVFAGAKSDLTLAELARISGIAKPTAFRILSTLAGDGLVIHNQATGTYNLGFFVLRLADTALAGFPIRDVARPIMRQIRDAVNETVVLSIRLGDFRYNIDSLESTHAIGQSQQVGVPIPLYAGAASRIILANMPTDELESYLARTELKPFTATTITDRGRLLKEIKHIQQQQYALSSGEFSGAGYAIAAAIRDSTGRATAALHITIPRARFTKELERRCIDELVKAAQKLGNS